MNTRQAHALANPVNTADQRRAGPLLEQLRTVRLRGDRTILVVILAIDR